MAMNKYGKLTVAANTANRSLELAAKTLLDARCNVYQSIQFGNVTMGLTENQLQVGTIDVHNQILLRCRA